MALLTLAEINNLDIVDFLASLGHKPQKISGHNYYYLSMLPDRSEKKPSFKVNRKKNRWIDFGYDAREHSLVDLGILLFDCSIRELVTRLSQPGSDIQTAHKTVSRQDPAHTPDGGKRLSIIDSTPIRTSYLIGYLWERRIPLSVARKYCVEVHYSFGEKVYCGIGFRCDAGGYEIRNKYHKYGTTPKSPTLISNGSKDLAVFEGHFDMQTFVTFVNCPDEELTDLLVLNGTGFFERQLPVMDTYRRKHLFLDNDPTGDRLTRLALDKKAGYLDHRPLYKGYKDLNFWACNIGKATIPCLRDLPAITQNKPGEPIRSIGTA